MSDAALLPKDALHPVNANPASGVEVAPQQSNNPNLSPKVEQPPVTNPIAAVGGTFHEEQQQKPVAVINESLRAIGYKDIDVSAVQTKKQEDIVAGTPGSYGEERILPFISKNLESLVTPETKYSTPDSKGILDFVKEKAKKMQEKLQKKAA